MFLSHLQSEFTKTYAFAFKNWIMAVAKLMPLTYFHEYYREFYGFKSIFSNILVKDYVLVTMYLLFALLLFGKPF